MNRLIVFFSFFIFFASQKVVLAQDLQQYLGQEAMVVGVLNVQSCSTKIDYAKILQSQAVQQIEQNLKRQNPNNFELLSQIYRAPAEVGINLAPKSYFFVEPVDSLWVTGFLFQIQELSLFEKLVGSLVRSSDNETRINQKGGFQYLLQNNMVLAWSKNVGVVMNIDGDESFISRSIDYADTLAYEKSEEMQAEFKVLKINTLINYIPKILTPQTKSISTQANYKAFSAQNFDMGFWVNMGKINNVLYKNTPKPPSDLFPLESFTQTMSELSKDTYFHTLGFFEKGELKLKFENHLNPKMTSAMLGVYDKRPNPQMLNYVNAKNLLGMMSFAIDVEKFANSTWAYYEPLLENVPKTGRKIKSWIDVLGVVIDEKAVYGLMKGDMLLAITDVKELETTYTSYEYDEEYNPITVDKKRKEKMPIFSVLASIGNKENFNKVIKLIESNELLIVEKDYYKLKLDKVGVPLYLAIQNDMLIFTNDTDLVEKHLKTGVPDSLRLKSDWQNLLKQHAFLYLMDFKGMINTALNLRSWESTDKRTLDNLKEMLDNLQVLGFTQKDNVIYSEAVLQMSQKDQNVINQLFELMDKAKN